MVSLGKYLNLQPSAAGPITVPDEQCRRESLLAGICTRMLDQVAEYACTADSPTDARAGLDAAKTVIEKESAAWDLSEEHAKEIEKSAVGLALSGRAAQDREAARRTAFDTQQVIGVLNDALLALTGGSQRSISRLERIQESLQRTSRIRDAAGLRASLGEAVTLIREETAREQEHAARDLAAFESKVIKVRRQMAENPARRLGGRPEAVRTISETLLALQPERALYAVAISVANSHAITQRYGPESVNELFLQVISERIQPLAESITSWRWSPACVVAMFESAPDVRGLERRLSEFSRAPFVYRMTLGSRTAVLKAGLSHMIVALTAETFRALLVEVDRFSGTEPEYAG